MHSRASGAMEDLLKPTIVLTPHPPKLLAKPAVLQPLMTLAREHLPLSFLDLTSPAGDLHPSRLYESHIRVLDLESRRGSVPPLLIARLGATGSLFALEQHNKGLYAACKLRDCVDVGQLAGKATFACRQLLQQIVGPKQAAEQDRSRPITTPALHKAQSQKRLAIEALQSVVRKKARTQSVSTLPTLSDGGQVIRAPTESREETPAVATETSAPTAEEAQAAEPEWLNSTPLRDSEPPSPPTGEELCERIRNQYFEALYRSKGSLAYFPKGSLSRARAAFHLDTDSTLNMIDLVDFLKGLVMTMAQINKKYQETVPSIIQEMKGHVESSDEGRSKKKRARKMKHGRNSLYPGEDRQIRTWWASNKPELKEGDISSSEGEIKSFITLLRTRETQLQMILMLEILALEPLAATDKAEQSQLPGIKDSIEAEAPKKAKKKQLQNLTDAVDMHADLLCIWQSTSSNEVRLLEDSQVTDHTREGQKAQRASSEPLRDFCVDIIMPFFHARLPEICDSLNRKLGGPVISSPPKAKQPQPKPKAPAQQAKPGTATKRPVPWKPKSLRRALSNEQAEQARRSMSRGPSKAVAALLSATETVVPGVKRENNDSLNLMVIPRKKSDYGLLRDKSTNVLSRSSSFSTYNDDVKSKTKALVEVELKEAISALRKPNRQLAGKAMMEAAERRTSGGGLSQLKKSRKPVQLGGDVVPVVKATPFGNRYRQAESQPVRPFASLLHGSDDVVPPSSASVIPATAPRPGFRDALGPSPGVEGVEATPARPTVASGNGLLGVFDTSPAKDRVAASPVRATLTRIKNGFLNAPAAEHTTATPVRRHAASSTPAGVVSATPPVRNIRDMFLTPVKPKVPLTTATATTNSKVAAAGKLEGQKKMLSVYERLGWDNDFDDL